MDSSCSPFFLRMKVRVSSTERQKIIEMLLELKRSCKPCSSTATVYGTLVKFTRAKGVRILEVQHLLKNRAAFGMFFPELDLICLQIDGLGSMLGILSHEFGHVVLARAGVCRKYTFEEEAADVIGQTAINLLTQ